MPATHSLRFNRIYIIESLHPDTDRKTGVDLADAIGFGQYGVSVDLKRPTNRDEFLTCLQNIVLETQRRRDSPILHVETHGSSGGIEVSSGGFIGWPEIKGLLSEINTASRLNLLVVMAACFGGHLSQILLPTERSPAWAVVGPGSEVSADDIAEDFKDFYRLFLSSYDGRRALEALNRLPVGPGWRYTFTPARYVFRQVYREYLNVCCTSEALEKRVDQVIETVCEGHPEPPNLRIDLRAKLNDHAEAFQSMRRHFFMIDLFPENDMRFPLTLADCLRDPSDDPA